MKRDTEQPQKSRAKQARLLGRDARLSAESQQFKLDYLPLQSAMQRMAEALLGNEDDAADVVQTTLGILLTGIFGFILGNKIRNQ